MSLLMTDFKYGGFPVACSGGHVSRLDVRSGGSAKSVSVRSGWAAMSFAAHSSKFGVARAVMGVVIMGALMVTSSFAYAGAPRSNLANPSPRVLCATVVDNVIPADESDNDSSIVDPKLQQVVRDDEKSDTETAVDISHGHIDIGPRIIDGQWRLWARDDSEYSPVWRPVKKIVFVVGDQSQQRLPEGDTYTFTGAKAGESVYTIPQTEIQGVPWLGWSTQSPEVIDNVDGQVKLTFEGHDGKGRFSNFLQEGLGASPRVLFQDSNRKAQTINIDTNTHTHSNWVFTEPGVHLIRLTASATLRDGSHVTDTVVLRFAVGAGASVADARKAQWTKIGTPQEVEVTSEHIPQESSLTLWIVVISVFVAGFIASMIGVISVKNARREKDAAWQTDAGSSAISSGNEAGEALSTREPHNSSGRESVTDASGRESVSDSGDREPGEEDQSNVTTD